MTFGYVYMKKHYKVKAFFFFPKKTKQGKFLELTPEAVLHLFLPPRTVSSGNGDLAFICPSLTDG